MTPTKIPHPPPSIPTYCTIHHQLSECLPHKPPRATHFFFFASRTTSFSAAQPSPILSPPLSSAVLTDTVAVMAAMARLQKMNGLGVSRRHADLRRYSWPPSRWQVSYCIERYGSDPPSTSTSLQIPPLTLFSPAQRYLKWLSINAMVFNVSNYRRLPSLCPQNGEKPLFSLMLPRM
jgi:hypothetical protein